MLRPPSSFCTLPLLELSCTIFSRPLRFKGLTRLPPSLHMVSFQFQEISIVETGFQAITVSVHTWRRLFSLSMASCTVKLLFLLQLFGTYRY